MVLDLEAFFGGLCDPDEWSAGTAEAIMARRRSIEGAGSGSAPAPRTVPELVVNRPTVIPGALHVDGDLHLCSALLVLGDLRVGGLIYGNPAHKILMVAGDIHCRAMELVRTYLFTAGALRADECVFVCAYGISMCVGGCETGLWLQDTWYNLYLEQESVDNIRARHIFVRDESVIMSQRWDTSALEGVVTPEAFRRGDNGQFDPFFLLDAVAGGVAALRE